MYRINSQYCTRNPYQYYVIGTEKRADVHYMTFWACDLTTVLT